MKAIVVGAGPVGCLAALRFRERGWDVGLFELALDPRSAPRASRRSINLTLCRRGLRVLPVGLRDVLYERGVPCVHRVVHQSDGSLASLPYGLGPDEHLLSIPRELLNRVLLEEVTDAGIAVRFGHECVQVDPERGSATFLSAGQVLQHRGDVVVGADGGNSVVRAEMGRRGARLEHRQEYGNYGYVELTVPPTSAGEHCWAPARSAVHPGRDALEYGLHVWPRGEFMIFAQPNRDRSYTASLFAPLISRAPGAVSLQRLTRREDVRAVFAAHFADLVAHCPDHDEQIASAAPGTLRTVRCSPYHHGCAVLFGDAAHTMVPYFGQGVNSGWEDVHEFFQRLDRCDSLPIDARVRQVVAQHSAARVPRGHAVTDLSLGNFNELVEHSASRAFQERHALERRLHRIAPGRFQPLLNMVSFSDLPYDEVVRVHRAQQERLDALCSRFDLFTQADAIIEGYLGGDAVARDASDRAPRDGAGQALPESG